MADPAPPPVRTREDLQRFFVTIHTLLWNGTGLNPDDALKHMMFFIAFILIEPFVDALGLPSVCRWSATAALTADPVRLFIVIKEAIAAFNANPVTMDFFMDKLEIDREHALVDVVRVMRALTRESIPDTDVIGDMVEYMQGLGSSVMAQEGQYFTPRAVCRLAFKLALEARGVDRGVRRADGSLCTFADFFCGTGGFVTEFIRGVKRVDPAVDWTADQRAVHAVDKAKNSVSATLLNCLAVTGMPFTRASVKTRNSFGDQLVRGPAPAFPGLSVDFSLSNPPYGGTGFLYDKHTNLDIQSVGVAHNDKVSAGVQLVMSTLAEDGGVAALVLPQGFFFASAKANVALRKKLCEEFAVRVVADVGAGMFANTGTKTSLIVFQRGVGPTTGVRFIKASDESLLGEATLEQLRGADYSFNHARYVAQPMPELDGYDWVALGDAVALKRGTFTSGSMDGNGTIPFYTCKASNPCGLHSELTFDHSHYVLFASGGGSSKNKDGDNVGMGKSYLVSGKSAYTPDVVALIPGERIDAAYLWGFLRSRRSNICQLANFTTSLGHISPNTIRSIKIPLPSLERQRAVGESIEAWATLKDHYEGSLRQLEKALAIDVREAGRGQPAVRLGDVATLVTGKLLTKKSIVDGPYPVIGGGSGPIGHHNRFNMREYTIVVAQVGNAGALSRRPVKIWGAANCFSLVPLDGVNENTLYYVLMAAADKITALRQGTAQPFINGSNVKQLFIQLPSLEHQRSLQPLFDEVQNLHAKIAFFTARMEAAIAIGIPRIQEVEIEGIVEEENVDEEPERPATPPPAPHPPPAPQRTTGRLDKMSKKDLVELCTERGITGCSRLKKDALIARIREAPGSAAD